MQGFLAADAIFNFLLDILEMFKQIRTKTDHHHFFARVGKTFVRVLL